MWLWIVLLTAVSALFYRLGGMGQSGRDKFPSLPGWFFDTKARDIGCGLCTAGAFFIMGMYSGLIWWHVALAVVGTIIVSLGALSTYWDWLFGYDNYFLHGFMCGLAYFPLIILTGDWAMFGVRAVVCAVFMGVWCHVLFTNDIVEETGRGGILVASLPILLI